MDGGLHFEAVSALAYPHYAVTGFLSGIENSDDIAGSEIGVQSRKQGTAQADVAGAGFLQEAVAASVNAPNCKGKVGVDARFAAAVWWGLLLSMICGFWIGAVVWPFVDCAESSHGLPTVSLPRRGVKGGDHAGSTKAGAVIPFQKIPEMTLKRGTQAG